MVNMFLLHAPLNRAVTIKIEGNIDKCLDFSKTGVDEIAKQVYNQYKSLAKVLET